MLHSKLMQSETRLSEVCPEPLSLECYTFSLDFKNQLYTPIKYANRLMRIITST